MNRIFEKFTLYDIVVIAMMAALGIAVKTIIVPLAQIATSALFIPGGAVAGGIYMMFIVIAVCVVRKPFTAVLMCLVQTIMITILGTMGTHGVMNFITYLTPGIGVEILYFIIRNKFYTKEGCFAGGVVANIIGTFAVNFVFFNLAPIPLLLSIAVAALSGGIGGLIAYVLSAQIVKLNPHMKKEEEEADISKQSDEDEEAGDRG